MNPRNRIPHTVRIPQTVASLCFSLLSVLLLGGCQWLTLPSAINPWAADEGHPSSDPATEARQTELNRLLAKADLALTKDRLTIPASDNALLYYRQVLALDPVNEHAQQGLENIVARYCSLARTAHGNGDSSKARRYWQQAESILGATEQTRAVARLLQTPAGQRPRALGQQAHKRYNEE